MFLEKKNEEPLSVAALPMYDLPELRDATDALWQAVVLRLAEQGIAAPSKLTRTSDPASIWTDPALLLAQTCGYPLATTLKGKVLLVATPSYRATGCAGGLYRSAIIVRSTARVAGLADLYSKTCALNDRSSNSGMNALRAEIAPLSRGTRFFMQMLLTGSHAASVDAVADGLADVAAIDCVTWTHLQRLRPAVTAGLCVLAWTAPTPGLPLITSLHTDALTQTALRRALADIVQDQTLAALRAELLLDDFLPVPLGAYDAITRLEQDAAAAGYPVLV